MCPHRPSSRGIARFYHPSPTARALIAVGRTCLDSIKELREVQHKDREEWSARMNELRQAQAATGEESNILIDTLDKTIRNRNGKE